MDTTQAIEEQKENKSLIERMFKAGAHFGYTRSRRHPSFKSSVFGSKDGSDIVNLEKTGSFLMRALDFVKNASSENKTIIFVGTKPEARKIVEGCAISLGLPYVSYRWIGGTFTNFPEIKKRLAVLGALQKKKEDGEFDVYTKKERLNIDREIQKLIRNFGGIATLDKVPGALFVIDPRHERTVVVEAKTKHIPIVALAGSDCNLEEIDYPIPANDSSIASITFFVGEIARAYKEGLSNRKPTSTDNDVGQNKD